MFRTILVTLFIVLATSCLNAEKARVVVLTDISNEPDDEQSLVRFLLYSNEYDVEGLIATTSTHLKLGPRKDLINRQVDAYAKVYPNLKKHKIEYPKPELLQKVVATGQMKYGMADVGKGKASPGSSLLLKALMKKDSRSLWVCVWGGTNTLAQTLFDAKTQLSKEDFKSLVKQIRVYAISDQDDSGVWLRHNFKDLFYIVSPTNTSWKESYRGTWTGISGDYFFKNGPGLNMNLVSNSWLEKNVRKNHGPLGELYPKVTFIMEGDTPSFLGLIQNGLGWHKSPAYGGWGGRYVFYQSYAETRLIWTDNTFNRDTIQVGKLSLTSNQATIWRWRKHFQHDFAARMDWCIHSDYKKANHNPVAIINGDKTKDILIIDAKPNEVITLSSEKSYDPDGDEIKSTWMVYQEAGTVFRKTKLSQTEASITRIRVPNASRKVDGGHKIHIILTVEDNGTPSLVSYRRVIVHIK